MTIHPRLCLIYFVFSFIHREVQQFIRMHLPTQNWLNYRTTVNFISHSPFTLLLLLHPIYRVGRVITLYQVSDTYQHGYQIYHFTDNRLVTPYRYRCCKEPSAIEAVPVHWATRILPFFTYTQITFHITCNLAYIDICNIKYFGAGNQTWTGTECLTPTDFKSVASTDSTIPAYWSGWQESNLLDLVPKTSGWPVPYIPILVLVTGLEPARFPTGS